QLSLTLTSTAIVSLALRSFPTRRSSDLQSFEALCGNFHLNPQFHYGSVLHDRHLGLYAELVLFCVLISLKVRKYLLLNDNLIKRSEEHTSELQSRFELVCRLLLEKKKSY